MSEGGDNVQMHSGSSSIVATENHSILKLYTTLYIQYCVNVAACMVLSGLA